MARILVLNPTLGTGGGSRWSLQSAEALAARGHQVFWVAGASPQPAAAWAELESPLFQRHVVRLRWPQTIAGRGRALCGTWRMLALLRWCRRHLPVPDAVLLDSVPFVITQAQAAFPTARVIFFCHFPEALYAPNPPWLLRPQRRYWIRREREGLRRAQAVLVNSHYTLRHLLGIFPEMAGHATVCHPAVRSQPVAAAVPSRHVLSVARWTPDKNLPLSLAAYAEYRRQLLAAGAAPLDCCIAGGFDEFWPPAHTTLAALERQRMQLDLPSACCRFIRNPSDAELDELYHSALALVHPAPLEHFGMIAPEAMLRGVPVIGIAGSGLADSVVDGVTGFLVTPAAGAIATRLLELHHNPALRRRLGATARQRVEDGLLLEHLGGRLETALLPP